MGELFKEFMEKEALDLLNGMCRLYFFNAHVNRGIITSNGNYNFYEDNTYRESLKLLKEKGYPMPYEDEELKKVMKNE